jgi:hypothetical protein
MQRARTFFFVAAGIFLLALTYHLGARSANAQLSANTVASAFEGPGATAYAVTDDGDVYASPNPSESDFTFLRNVFGGATPTAPQSFGQVRTRYLGRTPESATMDAKRGARDGR